MSVLNDRDIKRLCQKTIEVPVGNDLLLSNPPQRKMRVVDHVPMVDPFVPENVQPASIDVRLGNDFKIFQRDSAVAVDLDDPVDITKHVHVEDGGFLTLHPGEFILGVTMERVTIPNDIVARIEGKSSIGRLGLMAHVTAGYIDPGFRGPITLEMACFHPLAIKLRPGKLIAQLSFHYMTGPSEKPYQGRYQDAKGVESSKYGKDPDGTQ